MSMLSIPSYKTDDPNYRYKMPRLVAKVEGRGNGIRTSIVNMGDIARALKRPPDYPTKFCGHELGAQSKFDPAQGKATVNGAHEQRDLQVLIDKFIDKFVLCQNCNLPEIDLQLKKGRVTYRCNACGNSGEVDNTHKLATFILKNPPDGGDSTLGVKNKKSKEERQKERALKSKKSKDSDEDEKKGKSSKKDKDGKEKKKSKKTKKSSEAGSGDEDEEHELNGTSKKTRSGTGSPTQSEDESEEKKKKMKKSKKESEEHEELKYDSPEVVDVTLNLFNFVVLSSDEEVDKKKYFNSAITPSEFFNHLRLLQVSQGFNHRVKIYIALDVLFHTDLGCCLTPASLEKKTKYLVPVVQGMSHRDILSALEDFVESKTETVGFTNFPYFLQKLYSADILNETGILKHYNSKKVEGRQSYAKAKIAAKPFLDWLQQSDSDGDESGDESEEEVQPKTKKLGTVEPVVGVQQIALTKITLKDEDEDIDIDNI